MKIKSLFGKQGRRPGRYASGFSLVEVSVGMAVVATSAAALFSGFTSGFFTMQMARENFRATQILQEKTEMLRLYSWDQVNTAGFVPTTFATPYDPSSTNGGVVYQGTLTIAPCPVAASYSSEMRQVTITLNWRTGALNRSRTFKTYVAHHGLQNYVY